MSTRRILLVAGLVAGLALAAALGSGATAQAARPVVSVQPVVGVRGGDRVRKVIARAVRARGLRVTTDIPQAEGTGQYYTWAREAGLRAFVSGEIERVGRKRQRATLLVWSGHDGSIVGRWTVVANATHLPGVVARGFWPHLGRSLRRTRLPAEWRQQQIGPGPTQRINAGLASDDTVVGTRLGRRRP